MESELCAGRQAVAWAGKLAALLFAVVIYLSYFCLSYFSGAIVAERLRMTVMMFTLGPSLSS
jgi:hypothetical protein